MVALAGAGPWPQITSTLPLRTSLRITGTSPPGPLRCGSTTCSVNAVATAASKALPPRSRIPMPTAVAIQWVEVTTPKVPSITGRVVKGLGLMLPAMGSCALYSWRRHLITGSGPDQPALRASSMPRKGNNQSTILENRPQWAAIFPDHSGFAPENFTTLAHFSVSSATYFPNSAAEPVMSVAPMLWNRPFTAGSARIALTVALSLLTISAGVFFGAPMPYHALAS